MPDQPQSHNMRLIGHTDLNGFGNGGEGLSLQQTRDGRRFLYIAHESAPKNFTVVEVTDPRAPTVVAQTELPHALILELGYLGTKGTRLVMQRSPNRAAPGSPLMTRPRSAADARSTTERSSPCSADGMSRQRIALSRESCRCRRPCCCCYPYAPIDCDP